MEDMLNDPFNFLREVEERLGTNGVSVCKCSAVTSATSTLALNYDCFRH